MQLWTFHAPEAIWIYAGIADGIITQRNAGSSIFVDDESSQLTAQGHCTIISPRFQAVASESGTFSTVLGLPINNQEHFVLEYNATNLTPDVVAGPGMQATSGRGSSHNSYEPFVTPVTQNMGFENADGPGSSVPEPGTILLFSSGLIGIVTVRRRALGPKAR
ncbi:MAG TPA: PEP-CTERM sorting domain-containing protein [Terriglobales bacterium]|nr:PEP-CTERM sorting domain-containing protein [Terriglobales bacterium]